MIVFRNSRFGLIWTATLLSNTGNWLMIVAVPVYVLTMTGSVLSSGLVFAAETLPAILFAPLAGVLADRLDRRTVMIAADLLRMVAVLALVWADGPDTLWIIYLALFAESAIGQFFLPASRAVLPAIVGRGADLDTANSWLNAALGVVRLAGAPLGGALYAFAGFDTLVIIDAATYLLSALLLLGIGRQPVSRTTGSARTGSAVAVLWRQMREGVAFLAGHHVLRSLLVVSSLFLLANAVLNVLLVPYVLNRLHGGAREVGWLMSALGAGYLMSAWLGNALSRSGRLRLAVAGCLAAITAFFAGLFFVVHLAAALVFIGLVGLAGGSVLMLLQVQVQRQTPDSKMGRVSSAFGAVEMLATVVGAVVGSVVGQYLQFGLAVGFALVTVAVSAVFAASSLPDRVAVTTPEPIP
ncbi:MFS transporter [Actinoplanes derwentensis]|uniref:Predicted arabinose efflux permease, MFS family n=1 Tax=Actinoplanes derwentensis TaxID=113562 RepID=A0A1H2DDE5_9ACTN|nr:MFS transporter [Actinoplanes derwentensis]GID89561.1 MFS transporter [Actinoplanes derwentensis]SDT80522.1 Predicted arabinose efflux permease, MFS family [Actinoplanes derwentensis]